MLQTFVETGTIHTERVAGITGWIDDGSLAGGRWGGMSEGGEEEEEEEDWEEKEGRWHGFFGDRWGMSGWGVVVGGVWWRMVGVVMVNGLEMDLFADDRPK